MSRARDLADSADKDIAGTLTLDDLSVSGTVTGNVTGDLTGDVTGNLTGDTIGTHTGAVNATNITVTGVVTGNVTGDILGDVKADNGTVILDSGTNGRNAEFTGDVDLSAISSTISDTAVDIFVYDTRKDSDGGAWRKRTQHTSWYNETLNTSTRGSRKEFPAVAVIVVHQLTNSGKVTIYDGDDPDLPMWMVLSGDATAADLIPSFSGTSLSCVSALNGILMVGNGTYDIDSINFVEDAGYKYGGTVYTKYRGNIEQRSDGLGFSGNYGPTIVNRAVNDVAMTVLPNAPIDPATGLPVPTIAVATAGGISIIKDDGTVIDGPTSGFDTLSFNKDFTLAAVDYGGADDVILFLYPTWLSDGFNLDKQYYANTIPSTNYQFDNTVTDTADARFVATDAGLYEIGDYGLAGSTNVYSNPQDMIRYVTSDYNTGWMNGDIKLATLSDTDATNVTGSELVTGDDSTFTSSIGNWVAFSGATLSHDTNRMQIVSNGTDGYAKLNISGLTSGKQYVLTFDFDAATGSQTAYLGTNNLGAKSYSGTTGTASWTFTYAGQTYILVRASDTSGITSYVDNVTLRLAEEDRSVNGNGLQVFGTVTKSAVATGADLVAYSGWSASNYLQQPYNADLDFGTGDFSIIAWIKQSAYTNNYTCIIDKAEYGTGNNRIEFMFNSSTLRLDVNPNSIYSSSGIGVANKWICVAGVRRNGVVYLYADGNLVGSGTASGNVSNSSHKTWVGVNYLAGNAGQDKQLALLRISATAPSPEQIAKIYEDEKVLFQENAKATLYGTSDAVTALAYDDSTELLHVGTSAGRSVFQGLKRVDNTTTAVGAAISASNGLVADE